MNPVDAQSHPCSSAAQRLLLRGFVLLVSLLVPASAFAAFGYTDTGTDLVVDTGSGLVFQVSKTDGSINSIVFNGTEYKSTTGRFSHIASGLGTPTTVTPSTDGATWVKITLQTDPANPVVSNLTHYLIARNGESTIYLATFPTAEPAVGELRWITRLNYALIPNGPGPSDLHGTTGAIESTDVFGAADGTTRSKYYGDNLTHGKDRAMDLAYDGATGPGVGCWMVFGNRESSSGGPFFRDIQNQAGDDQEIYNYMNSGHNQTEPFRLNVLHGPYALVFTTGAAPTLPLNFSWMGALGLTGWVSPADRGAVSGTATGIPAGFQAVVGLANAAAQYWATVSGGAYTCTGVKPGTYTATLYKGELAVTTSTVTVAAGATTPLNLVSAEPAPSVIFRLGEWDGTPAGFLNADKIVQMHPQDVRMSPWTTPTFTIGTDDPATFPAIQFRGRNSPATIQFTLAPNQVVDLTLKIGLTCAYNSGRPQVTVNNFTSPAPAASTQPNSRSFTIGTYRGNNATFTFTLPASALVAGTNTLRINPISGSTDIGTWLSAGWVYDAVELDGPVAAPVITYVGGDPLVISGTAEPSRTITLTLDGSTPAGTATVAANGTWAIGLGAALTPGSHSFTAVARDQSGHASPASAPFVIDAGVTMPVITAAVGDTGTYTSGATTSDRVFSFEGTAAAGNSVTLTRVGTGVIGSVTANGSGQWTFDYTSVSLPDGANSFYATASAGAGNSASSPVFTLNLSGPPRIAIVRQVPTNEVITAALGQVLFRVTFNQPVNGVTPGAFSLAATDSASGSIASVSAGSGQVFDVTVNALAGTGRLRLDLKPDNGITDGGGNPEAGYTAGEHYTLVLPTVGNGRWTRPETGGLWSDPQNWLNAVIADGSASTADFSTLNLVAPNTVQLDSARTINRAVFGDTDGTTSAGWTVDNSGSAANTLTLAGATPTITVNALGTGAAVTLTASLVGTGGFTKAGPGMLVLASASPLTGPLSLAAGVLQLVPGGGLSLGNNPVALALNSQLAVAGGSFTTDGAVTATTSSFVVNGGTATLGSFVTNSDFGATLRVDGGTLAVGSVNIRRNSGAPADFGSGFIVTGSGVASAATVGLGTQNSTGAMSLEGGGALTVSGPVTIGNQATSGRGGAMRVLDSATFTATDAALGVLLCRNNGANANNVASATFTGGVSTVEKFTLGFDGTVTAGSATITLNGGRLYLGAGGIVKNGGPGFVTNLNFSSGLLGAKADWSTTVPINLPSGGNVTIQTADATSAPFGIALNGVVGGAGGFTKTGSGELLLGAANTFAGDVNLNAGSLRVTGSLAGGGAINLNGGVLTGTGTINKPAVLNSATIAAGSSVITLGGSGLTWNGGGRLAVDLAGNGVSGRLNLTGQLLKGAPGAYEVVFTPRPGFAAGQTYTVATFSSTTFTAADFVASGLPAGYAAFFARNGSSLEVTIKAIASVSLDELRQFYDGTPRLPVVTTNPAGLNVDLTYDGAAAAPTLPGTYAVVATIDDPVYTGSVSDTLMVTTTAAVRHAPTIYGGVDGSVQMLLPESLALSGDLSSDLLVPGTPTVRLNSQPTFAGVRDAGGNPSPSNYTVTLNGQAVLRYLVRQVNPVVLPTVPLLHAPAGTRSVTLDRRNRNPGDFATLRNLTLNSGAGNVVVPAGVYGNFLANGGTGFVLGVAGATTPSVYELQQLTLNGGATLQVVGPVLLRAGSTVTVNGGMFGAAAQPRWLVLEVASGGLTLNHDTTLHGEVIAPTGTVTLNSGSTIDGNVASDRLILNSDSLVHQAPF